MKITPLPKAPIQIQRDTLLQEASTFKILLAQKDNEIINLHNQLNLAKNKPINTIISKEPQLLEELKRKDQIIYSANQKEKELLDKVSILEKTNISFSKVIEELKIDKFELRQDKIKQIEQINSLYQSSNLKDEIINYQTIEIEKLKAINISSQVQFGNNIVESILVENQPSESEEESVPFIGNNNSEPSFSLLGDNND